MTDVCIYTYLTIAIRLYTFSPVPYIRMSVHNSLHGLDYKLKRKQLFGSTFVVCSPSVLHSFLLVPLGTRCHVLSGYGSLKGTWTAFRRPI